MVTGQSSQIEQSGFLRNIIDSLDHPFYVINVSDFTIAMANKSAADPESLPAGMTCHKLTHHENKPCDDVDNPCPVEEIKKTGKPIVVEHVHFDKNGEKRFVEVHGHPVFDEDGDLVQVIEYCLDITERKKAERDRERLIHTVHAKNKEMQSIVYIASHDLRSPIVNIQGFGGELAKSCAELLHLVKSKIGEDSLAQEQSKVIREDILQSLEFIRSSSNKIDMLVDGLLRVSRVGSAELSIVSLDMNELVGQVANSMRYQVEQKQIELSFDDLPGCLGDEVQIHQIFSNLIGNAVNYLDPDRSGKIHISGKVENSQSVYCIEDNGIGIAEEHQEKIFELFHRLNPEGSGSGEGLGLTIVRRILDRHNGSIRVESEVGVGSKFFVSVPAG